MAVTHIHAITGTLADAIDYAMRDKVGDLNEFNEIDEEIRKAISYTTKDKKGDVIYHTLTTTQNCFGTSPRDISLSMAENIGYWKGRLNSRETQRKDGKEVLAWHMWQSFDGYVSPTVANEIGRKLAGEIFKNFQVSISTHTNTSYTHNHFIICAWDLNGKKWNNCNKNYRWIRNISDRLCEEYGLNILEHTKDMKLIKYQDSNGVTRFYEPTDRKNEIIRKREENQTYSDDVNSYRHTEEYKKWKEKKLTNREIVKRDIDRLIPESFSYDNLLFLLREYGYTVKDKKKNGDWLKHITFIPPEAQNGVRDYQLSDDGFYVRENLTKFIEDMVKGQVEKKNIYEEVKSILSEEEMDKIPYCTSYEYGEIDIENINEDWRKDVNEDGEILFVKRTESERSIVRDTKEKDSELKGYFDTSELDRLIKEQNEEKMKTRKGRTEVYKKRREEILIEQIQDGLHSLQFLENRGYASLDDVRVASREVWANFYNTKENIEHIEKLMKKLKTVQNLSNDYEKIKNHIEKNSSNEIYMQMEYEHDKSILEKYEKLMVKYKVDEPEKMKEYEMKLQSCQMKYEKLELALGCLEREMIDFEKCMKTLERINEKERGMEAEKATKESKTKVEIVLDDKEREEKQEERRRKGGHEDR